MSGRSRASRRRRGGAEPFPSWVAGKGPGPARLLSALLAAAGVAHLVATDPYTRIVPRFLPARRALVQVSGLAELACAGGLLHPRTRRAAAWSAAALFVAVFPANVQMALDAPITAGTGRMGSALRWLRLPLQGPLVAWAVAVARSARRR